MPEELSFLSVNQLNTSVLDDLNLSALDIFNDINLSALDIFNDINRNNLDIFDDINRNAKLSATFQTTLTDFSVPAKVFGSLPFTITAPKSNSTGPFTYTSSNLSVATISGNTVTIIAPGVTTITAKQAATSDFVSATITAQFTVEQSSPANPVLIDSALGLLYFWSSTSKYARLTNSLDIKNVVSITGEKIFV